MHNIMKALAVSWHNIMKWMNNPRFYIIFALLTILQMYYIYPVKQFCSFMGYRVTPWLFPFLNSFVVTQMMMMFGIIFLFCDAPFIDEDYPYYIIRMGRLQWGLGQVLYIMIGTAFYFLFIFFAGIIILIPNLYLSNTWGKIIGTLALSDVGISLKIPLPINSSIVLSYSPVKITVISLLLDWCSGVVLGLIIFITNIYLNRAFGAILSSGIVLFDIAIVNAFPNYAYHFSPVSLARLSVLDYTGMTLRPSNQYAYIFFMVSIVLLSIIAVFSARKQNIQVLPPV